MINYTNLIAYEDSLNRKYSFTFCKLIDHVMILENLPGGVPMYFGTENKFCINLGKGK